MPPPTCSLSASVAEQLSEPSARLPTDLAAHLPRCPACRRAAADAVRAWPSDRTPSASLAEWLAEPSGTLLSPLQAAAVATGKTAALELGPYLLLDKLGAGGMGEVYRARHRLLRRTDAVKRIRADFASNPAAVKRFLREVEAAAKLHHPNVVQVYAADRAGSGYYLAMECVEGSDLAAYTRKHGRLPVEQACEYVRQAAEGVHHAYTNGVVHRDIKPGNLLVTPDGQVKVTDFGLARALDARDARSELTGPGNMLGTVDYIAPEQARDARLADTRSDVYALGCTLYFLLAAQPPFRGENAMETLVRHASDPVPPLSGFRADVPPAVEQIVQKCMAKQPADRFQTPGELAAALQNALVPVAAGPPLLPTAPFVDVAPEPLPLPDPSAEHSTAGGLRAETHTDEFSSTRGRASGGVPKWVWAALALVVVAVGVVIAVQATRDRKPEDTAAGAPPGGSPPKPPDETPPDKPKDGGNGEPKPPPKPPAPVEGTPVPDPGNTDKWKYVRAFRHPKKTDKVITVGFTPKGHIFAAREGEDAQTQNGWWELWRPDGTEPEFEDQAWPGLSEYEQVLAYDPEESVMITNWFRRWSFKESKPSPSLAQGLKDFGRGDAEDFDSLAVSGDGKFVVGGVTPSERGQKRMVILWNASDGTITNAWPVDGAGSVYKIAADKAGRRVAGGTEKGKVFVIRTNEEGLWREWDSADGGKKKLGPVTAITISPDGKRVYSAHDNDDDLHVWDADGDAHLAPIRIGWRSCRLVISPDGRWLLATGEAVGVWDLSTNPPKEHVLARHWAGELRGSAFSADSKRLLVGGFGKLHESGNGPGVVWLWELRE